MLSINVRPLCVLVFCLLVCLHVALSFLAININPMGVLTLCWLLTCGNIYKIINLKDKHE